MTDVRGEFKISVRDLPIGMKFLPIDDRRGNFMDSVLVDNLIGIAAVKDSFYHYDSIRIGAGDNFVNIVLDKISQKGKTSQEEIPQGYSLLRNYPNPFNYLTHLAFDVSEPVHVDIIIFNVLGRRIRKLLS